MYERIKQNSMHAAMKQDRDWTDCKLHPMDMRMQVPCLAEAKEGSKQQFYACLQDRKTSQMLSQATLHLHFHMCAVQATDAKCKQTQTDDTHSKQQAPSNKQQPT